MRVEQAIKMIENHGHKAFVTPEGLACVCECVRQSFVIFHSDVEVQFVHDDVVFEEVTTFPIAFNDWVNRFRIEDWLGY